MIGPFFLLPLNLFLIINFLIYMAQNIDFIKFKLKKINILGRHF